MEKLRSEYEKFLEEIEARLLPLGVKLEDRPIDHVGYRVEDKRAFEGMVEVLSQASAVYIKKFFRDRNFMLFVLREPLVYKDLAIPYLELPEPGGSRRYKQGFQHIEFHTNGTMREIVKNPRDAEGLWNKGKNGVLGLRWTDNMVVKTTEVPIITKFLAEGNPEIVVCGAR